MFYVYVQDFYNISAFVSPKSVCHRSVIELFGGVLCCHFPFLGGGGGQELNNFVSFLEGNEMVLLGVFHNICTST